MKGREGLHCWVLGGAGSAQRLSQQLSGWWCVRWRAGHRRMNPFCIPFAINNMGGAMLAMDLGFMGPNYSISTACATGNYCISK